MKIGIDFDNTIANYDDAFLGRAKAMGYVADNFVGGKQSVRDHVRLQNDGEHRWQQLQGYVYGKGIGAAKLIAGVSDFLMTCHQRSVPCYIVSHKTQFGHHDSERVDLREAALNWLHQQNLLPRYIDRKSIFFASTRGEKLERINQLGCTHFIDDLPEVLLEAKFPDSTRALWFASDSKELCEGLKPYRSWSEISQAVFA